MHIRILITLVALAAAGCGRDTSSAPPPITPSIRSTGTSEESFRHDLGSGLELYRAATNAQTAKVALQAWERVLAEYEAAGTKRIQLDYHQMVLQGRLYGVQTALGDTNAAADCRAKLTALIRKGAQPGSQLGDLQSFFESVEKIDADKGVRWRQSK